MKKSIYFLFCALSAFLMISCDGANNMTPETSTTSLWVAGEKGSSKLGYINKSGKMVLEAKYTKAYSFSCNYALVKDPEEGLCYINSSGRIMSDKMPDTETFFKYFRYNVCTYKDYGLRGLMNTHFQTVCEPVFLDNGSMTADGLLWGKKEDESRYGYYSSTGKEMIEPRFLSASDFVEGIAIVKEKNSSTEEVIDTRGKVLYSSKEDIYNLGSKRLSRYNSSTDRFELLTADGKDVSSATYSEIYPFSEGLACVEKNGKCGFINTQGDEVLQPVWSSAIPFNEGIAWTQESENSKWVPINKKGDEGPSLASGYEPMGVFRNGLCLVYNYSTGTAGYVNTNIEMVYTWSYKGGIDVISSAPQRLVSPRERTVLLMSDTEYGSRFEDWNRARQLD